MCLGLDDGPMMLIDIYGWMNVVFDNNNNDDDNGDFCSCMVLDKIERLDEEIYWKKRV